MSRPFPPRHPQQPQFRINGKIRAREVRVIGDDGQQLGIMSLPDAIGLARSRGVDLVEIAAAAQPPVCRIVDFGKFKYEQGKREKESRKTHSANKTKEVQLSTKIDPHDFAIKLKHAIDFLCEDMAVKTSLRFKGREMAHKEFGFQVMNRFITELGPWGHATNEVRLNGRAINVMIAPLPKQKRARHPDDAEADQLIAKKLAENPLVDIHTAPKLPAALAGGAPSPAAAPPAAPPPPPPPPNPPGVTNNPFAGLDTSQLG